MMTPFFEPVSSTLQRLPARTSRPCAWDMRTSGTPTVSRRPAVSRSARRASARPSTTWSRSASEWRADEASGRSHSRSRMRTGAVAARAAASTSSSSRDTVVKVMSRVSLIRPKQCNRPCPLRQLGDRCASTRAMSLHLLLLEIGKMLRNLDGCLDKAAARGGDERALLDSRLAPDMFPLVRQVQIACDTAKFAAARTAGKEAPNHADDETTIAQLKKRIAVVGEYLAGF